MGYHKLDTETMLLDLKIQPQATLEFLNRHYMTQYKEQGPREYICEALEKIEEEIKRRNKEASDE